MSKHILQTSHLSADILIVSFNEHTLPFVLFLECDEKQHMGNLVECEISRMADVQASLALAGVTVPVYWLRYSPCGPYRVDGRKQQSFKTRASREKVLLRRIAELSRPEFMPERQVTIEYLFYDVNGDVPVVTYDEAFAPLRDVVVCTMN